MAQLEARPDIALRALLAGLRERGIVVTYFAVRNLVRRAGKNFHGLDRAQQQRNGEADGQEPSRPNIAPMRRTFVHPPRHNRAVSS
jgi:hypothetical protein